MLVCDANYYNQGNTFEFLSKGSCSMKNTKLQRTLAAACGLMLGIMFARILGL
jgi:hypothetical protein